jgi:hypothetical protein
VIALQAGHDGETRHRLQYLDAMLYDDRNHRKRRRQAQYEARQRAGIAVYPVPLGADELDALIHLGWLRPDVERDRERVGLAIAAVIRGLIVK